MRSWVPLLAMLAASLLSCAGDDAPGEELRVLFVGNSLTYYNDLPGMVAALNGAINGARPLEVDMLASGGASIRDHLGDDALRRVVSEFDIVVLQDLGGWPLCLPADERCARSVSAIGEAVALARAAGARPLWYSTYQLMPDVQAALSERARTVAADLDVEVADVGAALAGYRRAGGRDAMLLLEDGHPDALGSWVAAATILRVLIGSELPERIVLEEACRTPWQGADLTRQRLASEQPVPPTDCSVPTADQLRRAIAAANAAAAETRQCRERAPPMLELAPATGIEATALPT